MENIVRVEHVRKTFKLSKKQQKINQTTDKIKVALKDLSFTVKRGEIYGLLGSNGAGKTTALRIAATLIKPDQGDIYINDISVKNEPEKIRKQIGFLTSELKLEDFFTPSYMFDFYSDLHGIDLVTRKERKEKLFKTFGIDSFAEVKIGDLSTGMKQKASLAVSLVHNPDLIIFDEPTNGLDVITAKTVTDFLISLKEEGKTIIISTHIFSLIEKLCDRVGIIVDGMVLVEDTVINLTKEKSLEDKFFEIYVESVGQENA